ncbi:hypothetical protein Taro_040296 [Colocasia esculenta]|uniref:Uncharacterized protein n=1 Tax=Colocasia esculenta TaxID=4460 RepID=A0A843WU40_COLES|nr:hypothetical protein [Colocasia esculenta]
MRNCRDTQSHALSHSHSIPLSLSYSLSYTHGMSSHSSHQEQDQISPVPSSHLQVSTYSVGSSSNIIMDKDNESIPIVMEDIKEYLSWSFISVTRTGEPTRSGCFQSSLLLLVWINLFLLYGSII